MAKFTINGQPAFKCFGCGTVTQYERWCTGHYGYAQRHCWDCRPKYHAVQRAANNVLQREMREGRLPRAKTLKCVDCGRQASGWEHRDYRNPLDLVPCCQKCNKKRGPGKWNSYHDARHGALEAPDCAAITLVAAA